MKQKDIALIVVVGIVAAVISLVVTQAVFVSKKHKEMTTQVVDPISSEFKTPDPAVFNKDAINPTQLIQIGDGNNTSQF